MVGPAQPMGVGVPTSVLGRTDYRDNPLGTADGPLDDAANGW
jgi:hypothetical protein